MKFLVNEAKLLELFSSLSFTHFFLVFIHLLSMNNDVAERENVLQDLNQLSGEGNVESMLLVEKGLRKLSSLKVGEAVAIAMAQQRWTSSTKSGLRDDLKLPFKGRNLAKAFELRQDESEDVLFKQVSIAANNASKEKTQRYLGTTREEESLNILLEFVPGGSISLLLRKFGSFPESVMKLASMLYETVVVGVGIPSQERDNAQGHQGSQHPCR